MSWVQPHKAAHKEPNTDMASPSSGQLVSGASHWLPSPRWQLDSLCLSIFGALIWLSQADCCWHVPPWASPITPCHLPLWPPMCPFPKSLSAVPSQSLGCVLNASPQQKPCIAALLAHISKVTESKASEERSEASRKQY